MTFWIIADRRSSEQHVHKTVIEGRVHSIYFNLEAANAARYPTEKVWEIQIKAKEVESK